MRTLFKTILLFTLLSLSLSASTHIDEYKVDLYYANGILIEFEKDVAEEIWLTKAFDLLANNPEQSRHIQDYKVAYNHSNGVTSDLFESFLQKAEAEPGYKVTFEAFKLFIATKLKHADDLLGLAEQANNSVEATDLSEQVKAYKDSIKNGHGVIVISHSQGNLFTNRAYFKLDDWMKPYFHNMGVATPAGEVASGGPYVTFDNDPIHHIPGSLDDNLYNENRYYSHTNALGERVEALTGAFHAFDYYLGSTASINDVDVSTNEAADKIKSFIVDKIKLHVDAPSQYKIDLTFSENTKNHRVTLQHKYDIDITMMDGVEVFPFNEDKKLYYVDGNVSEDITGYVMASFGGTKILDGDIDDWEDKQDDEVYYLVSTDETIVVSNLIENIFFTISYSYKETIKQSNEYESFKYLTVNDNKIDISNSSYNPYIEGNIFDEEDRIVEYDLDEKSAYLKHILELYVIKIKLSYNQNLKLLSFVEGENNNLVSVSFLSDFIEDKDTTFTMTWKTKASYIKSSDIDLEILKNILLEYNVIK